MATNTAISNNIIIQGTTPTHEFELDFSTDICKEVRFVYSQNDSVVVLKDDEEITRDGNKVSATLTQEDTYSFEPNVRISLVLRILTISDTAIASDVITLKCRGLADKEVLV